MGADSIDELSFEGLEDEDVTAFFRTFFRLALKAGHNRDESWLQDHLDASLGGAALRYYVSLDEETRSKFQAVRTAMIARFSGEGEPPMAAAAPPPAAAAPPSERSGDTTMARAPQLSEYLYQFCLTGPSPIRGRIRVVLLADPSDVSYVYCERYNSHPAYKHWDCSRTSTPAAALTLEYLPLRNTVTYVRVPSESDSERESFLGMSSHHDSAGLYFALNFCSRGQTLPVEQATAFRDSQYSAWSRMWTIDPLSKELTPYFLEGPGWKRLIVGTEPPDKIFFRYEGSRAGIMGKPAKLMFEPFN